MLKKSLHQLGIDPTFRDLIHPLSKDEFRRLESSIIAEGCREALITWNGVIVDGHNRYDICRRQGIPFLITERDFDSKEDAISWICANQLGRRNISEETRKYLIGKRFEAEKIINARKNSQGWNQYSAATEVPTASGEDDPSSMRNRTAERLGAEYHLSHCTVEKYASFSKAIDRILVKAPSVAPLILSGQLKIAHSNVVALSHLQPSEIIDFSRKVAEKTPAAPFVPYNVARGQMPVIPAGEKPVVKVGIKTMPVYDPDSEITGLTLTIPSWRSSIERARGKADMQVISTKAKDELQQALLELLDTVHTMLVAIKE